MVSGTFGAWFPPPTSPPPHTDPPLMGAPYEIPDDNNDDLEALDILVILFDAL